MKWTEEAEQAISRVPFFVRRRVRKRVEEEAQQSGSQIVTIEHVRDCQKKFLKNMDERSQRLSGGDLFWARWLSKSGNSGG